MRSCGGAVQGVNDMVSLPHLAFDVKIATNTGLTATRESTSTVQVPTPCCWGNRPAMPDPDIANHGRRWISLLRLWVLLLWPHPGNKSQCSQSSLALFHVRVRRHHIEDWVGWYQIEDGSSARMLASLAFSSTKRSIFQIESFPPVSCPVSSGNPTA